MPEADAIRTRALPEDEADVKLPGGATPPGAPGEDGKTTQDHFEFLWREYEKQTEKQKNYNNAGVDIYPRAGCVLKTWVVDVGQAAKSENNPTGIVPTKGQKVFINLCSHELIDPPSEVTEIPAHLRQKGQVDDGSPKMRLPLSCGPLRQCADRDGSTSLVVDVAFNPDPLSKFEDREYRHMVASFALHNVQNKFQIGLRDDFKFPKMRYKPAIGDTTMNPLVQRIRKPAAKKVEELDKEDPLTTINTQAKEARTEFQEQVKKTPQYQQLKRMQAAKQGKTYVEPQEEKGEVAVSEKPSFEALTVPEATVFCELNGNRTAAAKWDASKLPSHVCVLIQLPLVKRASELELELSPFDLGLTTSSEFRTTHNYNLDVQFPFVTDDGAPKVKLLKKTHTLSVVLPVTGRLPTLADVEAPLAQEEEAEVVVRSWRTEVPLSNKLMYRLCA